MFGPKCDASSKTVELCVFEFRAELFGWKLRFAEGYTLNNRFLCTLKTLLKKSKCMELLVSIPHVAEYGGLCSVVLSEFVL